MILKRQAVLGYPTFPVSLGVFRVPMECLAAILACSLIHGTHVFFFFSGNVFEDLPAPSEPPAAFFGNSTSSASAQCEPESLNTGRLADRANELERNTQYFANTYTKICKEVFNMESSLSRRRSFSAELHGCTAEESSFRNAFC